MNGPQHYRKAELLLDLADESTDTNRITRFQVQAYVHATLADAAARIDACRMTSNLRDEWVSTFRGEP